jgi:hypothetical protein
MKGISPLSYLCGIWLTSVQTLLKQDVIIIGLIISLPNEALSGIGSTFTRNGLGVEISTVFEIFGHLVFQGDGTTP